MDLAEPGSAPSGYSVGHHSRTWAVGYSTAPRRFGEGGSDGDHGRGAPLNSFMIDSTGTPDFTTIWRLSFTPFFSV
jgi:hypothetical protein